MEMKYNARCSAVGKSGQSERKKSMRVHYKPPGPCHGAGFDMKEFTCMYGEEKIRDAVKYGKDLKDRYTVLWLYEYRNG